jgi:hypothetical protein
MTEIEVMGQVDALLGGLADEAARQRVLDWAAAKYGTPKFKWTLQNPKFGPDGHLNVPLQGTQIPYVAPDPNRTTGVTPDHLSGRTITICDGEPVTAIDFPTISTFWSDTTGCAAGVAHLNPFG